MNNRLRLGLMTVFLIVMLSVLPACSPKTPQPVSPPKPVTRSSPGLAPIRERPLAQVDFRTVIMKVAQIAIPAVVHIEVTQRQEVSLPQGGDPFFRFFFDNPGAPRKFRQEVRGLGSGMLVDERGHILTNNHVVRGASDIEVTLSDGRKFPASLIGADLKTDLAVIKIDAKEKLPFVKFSNSDAAQVGEWVVAIGHPRGLDQTVTQGIISAKHRHGVTEPSSYEDFLQTDAAINPGNSGGPLLNLDARVIGVNAAIASQSGGFEGIGFAIPSNMAARVCRSLIEHGKVERGWIGVSISNLSQEKALFLGLSAPRGALIADMAAGGPAQKAGMRTDDVIVAVEDRQIADADGLRNVIAEAAIDQDVNITVWRDKQRVALRVKVGSMADALKLMSAMLNERLGLEVRPMNAAEAGRFGLDQQQGVVIKGLNGKSPLASAGFEKNDIILGINNQPVDSMETLAMLISQLQHKKYASILAVDHRSGRAGKVAIAIP